MVEIIEVKTRRQTRAFADFPLKHYKGCPYYVPSFYSDELNVMNPKKNPLLADCDIKCFLAYKNGGLAGRIAGIIQRTYNSIKGIKTVRFSRLETIDDAEVAQKLLGAVEAYGKEAGMNVCHGPWGFNDQDREGMLVYGFDKKSTYATNYNYSYYEQRVLDLGYSEECEWVEYKFEVPEKLDERYARIAAHVGKKFRLKEIAGENSIKQLVKNYGHKILNMVNISYADLDGYVPLEGKTLQNVLDQFSIIINPRFVSVVLDGEDNVVGFGCALADITGALQKSKGRLLPFGFLRLLKAIKKPTGLELALIAVLPEYQKKGVNAMVISRIMQNIIESGIKNVESNPELATNDAVRSQWDTVGKELIKRRKCYIKNI